MKNHDTVIVEARVLRVHEHVNPAYSTVDLQLADGQFLQTNVRNVQAPAELEPDGEIDEGEVDEKDEATAETATEGETEGAGDEADEEEVVAEPLTKNGPPVTVASRQARRNR